MSAKKKLSIILAVVAAILFALIAWIIWGNTALELNCAVCIGANGDLLNGNIYHSRIKDIFKSYIPRQQNEERSTDK